MNSASESCQHTPPSVAAAGRHLQKRRRTRVGGGAAMMSRGVGTEYVGGQSELYRCFPGNGTDSSRKNRKQRLGGTFANCCARQIPKAGKSWVQGIGLSKAVWNIFYANNVFERRQACGVGGWVVVPHAPLLLPTVFHARNRKMLWPATLLKSKM